MSDAETADAAADPASGPTLTVTRGRPSDAEVAAVVIALATRGPAPVETPPPANPSGWSNRWRSVRRPLRPGPGAWQAQSRMG